MPEARINTGFRHFNLLFKLGKLWFGLKLFCLCYVWNTPIFYSVYTLYFDLLIFCCQSVATTYKAKFVEQNNILWHKMNNPYDFFLSSITSCIILIIHGSFIEYFSISNFNILYIFLLNTSPLIVINLQVDIVFDIWNTLLQIPDNMIIGNNNIWIFILAFARKYNSTTMSAICFNKYKIFHHMLYTYFRFLFYSMNQICRFCTFIIGTGINLTPTFE